MCGYLIDCSSTPRTFGTGAGSGGGSGTGGADGGSAHLSGSGGDTAGNEATSSAAGDANSGGDDGNAGAVGVLDCTAALIDCGGNCVNPDKDSINCGTCGHDCLGGECILGVCQPIEIAKNQGREFIVAVDDHFIYWGGDGAVVGKKGIDNTGPIIELVPASAHEYAYAGALVGQTFYWDNDWKDSGVRGCSLPMCAGGPSLLIPGTAPPGALTYNAGVSTLYWPQGSSLWHKVLPAGAAEQFTVTSHAVSSLTSDDSFVYWSEYDSTAKTVEIRKVPLGGGTSNSLAMGLQSVGDLAPYGKNLFVAVSSAGGMDIATVALPNGIGAGRPKPFAPAGEETLKMRVDESGVYWTQRDGSNGSIRHCPLTGCAADTEILAPSAKPWGITTDNKAVYWTTEEGFVMKLAK